MTNKTTIEISLNVFTELNDFSENIFVEKVI